MKYVSLGVTTYLTLRVLTAQYDWRFDDWEYWLTIFAAVSLAATAFEFARERRERLKKLAEAARRRRTSSDSASS